MGGNEGKESDNGLLILDKKNPKSGCIERGEAYASDRKRSASEIAEKLQSKKRNDRIEGDKVRSSDVARHGLLKVDRCFGD